MSRRVWWVFLLIVSLLHGVHAQSPNDGSSKVVSDGSSPNERDNASVAQTAILVTGITCAIGAMLCCGAFFYLVYQKCCVEECII